MDVDPGDERQATQLDRDRGQPRTATAVHGEQQEKKLENSRRKANNFLCCCSLLLFSLLQFSCTSPCAAIRFSGGRSYAAISVRSPGAAVTLFESAYPVGTRREPIARIADATMSVPIAIDNVVA